MPYKENCKVEGEIMTKFKIARIYFANNKKQKEISKYLKCHKNTINQIIKKCKEQKKNNKIWEYLNNSGKHISQEKLNNLFAFLKYKSRKPKSHKLAFQKGSKEEKLIIEKFRKTNYGHQRMHRHLSRQGYDVKNIYTKGKIKGIYKRKGFKIKKVRTSNGNRRTLYKYDEIEAFQFLQYDTKDILDKKALPKIIYDKFKNNNQLPKYQWTIVDAKTKIRFLAWSHSLSSFFGFSFLNLAISWIRSHGVQTKINIQMDMGGEFYSGSKRKQEEWNNYFKQHNAYVYDTEGAKWKQNLVERTHRIDDEEFYCPRGSRINAKTEFMTEAQFWIIYYNNRSSSGIDLNGISPKEKLDQLGFYNAKNISNFPCLILEDFFNPLQTFFKDKIIKNENIKNNQINKNSQNFLWKKSHYVLTHYHIYF